MKIITDYSNHENIYAKNNTPSFKAKLKFDSEAKKLLEEKFNVFKTERNINIDFKRFFTSLQRTFSLITKDIEGTFFINRQKNEAQMQLTCFKTKNGDSKINPPKKISPEDIIQQMFSSTKIKSNSFIDAIINYSKPITKKMVILELNNQRILNGEIFKTSSCYN